tara:strand:- start:607 stop:756 length:150 start_codon:yes stop_codon:yes gene_type:complete
VCIFLQIKYPFCLFFNTDFIIKENKGELYKIILGPEKFVKNIKKFRIIG